MANASKKMSSKKSLNWLERQDSQHRQYMALAIAAITFLIIFFSNAPLGTEIICPWLAYSFTLIILYWIAIFTSHPRKVRAIAGLQDSSRALIFLFVIAAATISVLVVIFLLKTSQGQSQGGMANRVLISVFSVVSSWLLVHTVFTMHYAHIYYYRNPEDKTSPVAPGGLDFPNEKEPDYLDFAYFSFVIGTTFQVSDVQITSRRIRRLALIHCLISFVFNTVILALSINIISSLVKQ